LIKATWVITLGKFSKFSKFSIVGTFYESELVKVHYVPNKPHKIEKFSKEEL